MTSISILFASLGEPKCGVFGGEQRSCNLQSVIRIGNTNGVRGCVCIGEGREEEGGVVGMHVCGSVSITVEP